MADAPGSTSPARRRSKSLLGLAFLLLVVGGIVGGREVHERRRGRHWRIPSPFGKAPVEPSLVDHGDLLAITKGAESDVWSLEGPEPLHLGRWTWWSASSTTGVTFSPWRDVALVQEGRRVEARSVRSGERSWECRTFPRSVRASAVSPKGTLVASPGFGRDGVQSVEVRSFPSGELVRELKVPADSPPSVTSTAHLQFSAEEDALLACYAEGTYGGLAYVWSLETGSLRCRFKGSATGFTPRGEVLVSVNSAKGASVDEDSPDTGKRTRHILDEPILRLCESGERAFVGLARDLPGVPVFPLDVYSLETGKRIRALERPGSLPSSNEWGLDVSAEGDRLAFADEGVIDVWEIPR